MKTSIDVAWCEARLSDVMRLHEHFERRLAQPPVMDGDFNITGLYQESLVVLKELIVFWTKVIERKRSI
jgi:hypothetical protein